MAVATISLFDTITDSADAPVAGVTVTLTFNYTNATTADGQLQPTSRSATTDSTGKWTFPKVIPNDLISPANSTYIVETPFRSYLVAPQSGNGASQRSTAANVIVNVPSPLAPSTSNLTGPLTVQGLLIALASAVITGTETVSGLLSANGGITLGGIITRAATSAKVLLSAAIGNLAVSFNGAAGTAEQEVTGLRVSLPVIAAICLVKIQFTGYVGTGAGNTAFRLRAGTSVSYLTNPAVFDGGYVGPSGTDASFNMTTWVSLDLSTQTYVSVSIQNDVSGATVTLSATGSRCSIITEVYQ